MKKDYPNVKQELKKRTGKEFSYEENPKTHNINFFTLYDIEPPLNFNQCPEIGWKESHTLKIKDVFGKRIHFVCKECNNDYTYEINGSRRLRKGHPKDFK